MISLSNQGNRQHAKVMPDNYQYMCRSNPIPFCAFEPNARIGDSMFILSFKTWSYGLGKRIKALPSRHCIRSFSLMPKENEPKERAPASLGPSGTLRAVKSAGSLKTRVAQIVQTPSPSDFTVLSSVPMGIEPQPL